jgi:hypothetical protein
MACLRQNKAQEALELLSAAKVLSLSVKLSLLSAAKVLSLSRHSLSLPPLSLSTLAKACVWSGCNCEALPSSQAPKLPPTYIYILTMCIYVTGEVVLVRCCLVTECL